VMVTRYDSVNLSAIFISNDASTVYKHSLEEHSEWHTHCTYT
jgi:hypothetical protein